MEKTNGSSVKFVNHKQNFAFRVKCLAKTAIPNHVEYWFWLKLVGSDRNQIDILVPEYVVSVHAIFVITLLYKTKFLILAY